MIQYGTNRKKCLLTRKYCHPRAAGDPIKKYFVVLMFGNTCVSLLIVHNSPIAKLSAQSLVEREGLLIIFENLNIS